MTKEEIYENHIRPLTNQIYDICERHDIAMLAVFALGVEQRGEFSRYFLSGCRHINDQADISTPFALAAQILYFQGDPADAANIQTGIT